MMTLGMQVGEDQETGKKDFTASQIGKKKLSKSIKKRGGTETKYGLQGNERKKRRRLIPENKQNSFVRTFQAS